jgi:CRISPR-associated protein Cas1
MKPLLNTLYVTTDGAYLATRGETVCVRVERETKAQFPVHVLEGIVCFGRVGFSPKLLDLCSRRGVPLSILSTYGRFMARVNGPTSGNVLLRRAQYRLADDLSFSAEVARSIVIGKVSNCRTALLRAGRERTNGDGNGTVLKRAAIDLADVLRKLSSSQPLDVVRGCEGEAAAAYFRAFDDFITAQKDDFRFFKRSRRPPLDAVNALLSFYYTLLMHDCLGAVESVGLDPAVGFLHRDRPGRPGLALDLMEELRPILADRVAVSLINRRQIRASGFRTTESGAVMMDDATRKEVLVAYQTRKQDTIKHPFINEEVPLGLLPHVQAMLLARYLRGDLDGYPPFLWK